MHILSEELAAFLRVEHCCVSHVQIKSWNLTSNTSAGHLVPWFLEWAGRALSVFCFAQMDSAAHALLVTSFLSLTFYVLDCFGVSH